MGARTRTRSRRGFVAVGGAALALALAPTPASAAGQRYASPGGSGTACSSSFPCDIVQAFTGLTSGTEVIVEPGDYYKPGAPAGTRIDTQLASNATDVTVHGIAGQGRPRIFSNFGSGAALELDGAGDSATYLYVDSSVAGLGIGAAATGSELIVRAQVQACDLTADGALLADSVCTETGDGSVAAYAFAGGTATMTLRNVTAEATGAPSTGILDQELSGSVTLNVTNSIAQSHGTDVATTNSGGVAALNIDHSNFTTSSGVTQGPGNQVNQPPQFANAAGGDYHEVAGSPTIDAGFTDPANGQFDLDGDPRTVGAGTDIGADEFVPTPAGPGGGGPPVGTNPLPTPATPFPGATTKAQTVKVVHGVALIAVTCSKACAGTLVVTTASAVKLRPTAAAKRKKLKLGKAPFALAAGQTKRVKVKISKAGLRLLSKRHRIAAIATATAHDASGAGAPTGARVTLVAAKRRKR